MIYHNIETFMSYSTLPNRDENKRYTKYCGQILGSRATVASLPPHFLAQSSPGDLISVLFGSLHFNNPCQSVLGTLLYKNSRLEQSPGWWVVQNLNQNGPASHSAGLSSDLSFYNHSTWLGCQEWAPEILIVPNADAVLIYTESSAKNCHHFVDWHTTFEHLTLKAKDTLYVDWSTLD